MALTLAATGLGVVTAGAAAAAPTATPVVVYDSRPADPAPTYASLGFAATSTSQFGDLVQLAGDNSPVIEVVVNLTSWACEEGAWNTNDCVSADDATFTHPITLNFYEVDRSGPEVAAGALIDTVTVAQDIPYRPSASDNCTDGDAGKWEDGEGNCWNGLATDVVFSGLDLSLGDEVIVGIAYNTQNHGDEPVGTPGPYDALNVSLSPDAPSVGADENADEMFWQTTYLGADGTWSVDTGWDDFNGLVMTITAEGEAAPAPAPEPELAETGVTDTVSGVIAVGAGVLVLGIVLASGAARSRAGMRTEQ